MEKFGDARRAISKIRQKGKKEDLNEAAKSNGRLGQHSYRAAVTSIIGV